MTGLFGGTDAPFTEACVPSACQCAGHRFPGVRHIAACCNEPHIDQVSVLGLMQEPNEDTDGVQGPPQGEDPEPS